MLLLPLLNQTTPLFALSHSALWELKTLSIALLTKNKLKIQHLFKSNEKKLKLIDSKNSDCMAELIRNSNEETAEDTRCFDKPNNDY